MFTILLSVRSVDAAGRRSRTRSGNGAWMLTALALAVGGGVVVLRWQERPTLRLRAVSRATSCRVGSATRLYGFVAGFVKALEMLDSPRRLRARLRLVAVPVDGHFACVYMFGFIGLRPGGADVAGSAGDSRPWWRSPCRCRRRPGSSGPFNSAACWGWPSSAFAESEAIAFSIVAAPHPVCRRDRGGSVLAVAENISLRDVEGVRSSRTMAPSGLTARRSSSG